MESTDNHNVECIKPQLELFKSTGASVIVYGETYRTVQNKIGIPILVLMPFFTVQHKFFMSVEVLMPEVP